MNCSQRIYRFFLACTFLSLPLTGWAGESETKAGSHASPEAQTFWSRHFEVKTGAGATRFRYMDNGPGQVTSRDLQYKVDTRFRIKLLPGGSSYIQARGETGGAFNSGWPNTGVGRANREWVFNMKAFFVGQKFGPHAEAQVGGLEFDRGAGSEATYADGDGYLVGYRMRLVGKGQGWVPRKFSVTVGYVGDFKRPNVFSRLDRLGEANYVQVLAENTWGGDRTTSIEFDSIEGIQFARGALRWKKLPAPVFDDFQLEAIARATDNPSFGWSARLSKELDQAGRWRAGIIYSHIPTGVFDKSGAQVLLNGDPITLGQRVGVRMGFAFVESFDVVVMGTRKLDSTPNTTRWRGEVMIRYKFASLMNGWLQ